MAKKKHRTLHRNLESEVFAQWLLRSSADRQAKHLEQFSDDLWRDGTRLSPSQHTHYQTVTNMLYAWCTT